MLEMMGTNTTNCPVGFSTREIKPGSDVILNCKLETNNKQINITWMKNVSLIISLNFQAHGHPGQKNETQI